MVQKAGVMPQVYLRIRITKHPNNSKKRLKLRIIRTTRVEEIRILFRLWAARELKIHLDPPLRRTKRPLPSPVVRHRR